MNKPTYDQLQSQLAAALAKNALLGTDEGRPPRTPALSAENTDSGSDGVERKGKGRER